MASAEMNADELLSECRALFDYDPETGDFVYKVCRGRAQAGSFAGTTNRAGYRQLCVGRRIFLGHRIAWLMVHGALPPRGLDHINRNRADNRISNLRPADQSENMQNAPDRSHNTSGFPGVSRDKRKKARPWVAAITLRGRKQHIGNFSSPEEAHRAYLQAKVLTHPFQTIVE